MNILLGLDLDGQHSETVISKLDAITVGPLGMLNLLETQLGLLRLETPNAQRIVQYRDCLKRLDTPERFYHASFQCDEFGVAASLLAWRDEWHLHGWPGVPEAPLNMASSARLRDLSAVEQLAVTQLAPCLGERLKQVAEELQSRSPRIHSLRLCDPLKDWPQAWQKVLVGLPLHSVPVPQPQAPTTTLLGEVQTALHCLAQGGKPEKLQWRDDLSLQIIQSETRLQAGRWLAQQLAYDRSDTLLLAPDGGWLDEILVAAEQPRQGFRDSSPFRPALQVVPLALDQLWQPVDLYGLLKFLTHPVCPIPAVARHRLAALLSNSPGIGRGMAWDATLVEIERDCAPNGLDWFEIRERIQFWIEHERFEPQTGAPLEVVRQRLIRLANYFRGRLNDAKASEQSAWASGQAQALACQRAIEALAIQEETHIRPQALRTLVQQATAQGTVNSQLQPEVGACRTATQPGAVIDDVARVIWWQLSAPSLPGNWPWSLSEILSLSNAGIALPEVERLLSRQALAWQKPILACREQLILVLPPPGTEVHPLWLLLESLFTKQQTPAITSLETLLIANDLPEVPHHPLPVRKRWWQLPPNTPASMLPRREKESFSSLESFLFNPYQWVLRYPAKLQPSRILSISDSFLLYGTLAHHLVEGYFSDNPGAIDPNDAVFQAWFDAHFDPLIDEQGAILRLLGRGPDLEDFRRRLRNAMGELRRQLRAAGVVKVEPEVELNGHFVGGKLSGYGDLRLTRHDGQQAIVDMKWAGGKKYLDKLANNRHLQLVIYGELQRQHTGHWPRLAYFLIHSGELLATDRDFFPQARVVRKQKTVQDEGPSQLWQRFLKTWEWRRAQLDQGQIEVVIDERSADLNSLVPEQGLTAELLNPAYNDYLTLAGWEENQ